MKEEKLDNETFAKIQKLEEDLWRAETRFDKKLMDKIFSRDFREFGRSGKCYNREEILDISGDTIDAKLPLPNFKAKFIASDVIHVTYNSELIRDGKVEKARRSSIWSYEEEDWVLRFHQGTPYDSV